MKFVFFGLTISSSWGNGHATLLRGLFRALAARGHRVVFFERDVPYYAAHRDLVAMDGCELVLYAEWADASARAAREVAGADAAFVTSYCPDAVAASELVLGSRLLHVFYDLDAPVTLERLRAGEQVAYIPPRGLGDFDLVLSYTGGGALEQMRERLGARRVAPLYGSVDPEVHRPVEPAEIYRADLSYLGTYAEDRQAALEELFLSAARLAPGRRFLVGGSKYPQDFPWRENIFYVMHVPPPDHPAFYSSSLMTLNVTRRAMAECGFCPSGRLFEAAACATPVLSDWWQGLEQFFEPGEEILIARSTQETLDALSLSDAELARIACRARERTLEEHTARRRALELEMLLEAARGPSFEPWQVAGGAGLAPAEV